MFCKVRYGGGTEGRLVINVVCWSAGLIAFEPPLGEHHIPTFYCWNGKIFVDILKF